MNRLYAPWRSNYVRKIERTKRKKIPKKDCVFCKQIKEHKDDKNFVLGRYKYHVIMLNKFPYNAGHLLIVPYDHVENFNQQSKAARAELAELMNHSCQALRDSIKAQGINIGLNLGEIAGAGLPGHIHTHILPRWFGDTNFLPTLTDTKQISVDLEDIFKELQPFFSSLFFLVPIFF